MVIIPVLFGPAFMKQKSVLNDQNPYITSSSRVLKQNNVSSLLCLTGFVNDSDQRCIQNITIGEGDDYLYWSKESMGHYSVRSAYRLLQAQKNLWRKEDNDSLWLQI